MSRKTLGVFYQPAAGLQYYSLFHEKLVFYCGAGHPLYEVSANATSVEDLMQCDYIERTYGQTLSHLNKPLDLKTCAFSSSLEATAILIQTGKYIGLLPEYYALQWSKQELMKPLLADEFFIESEISAVIHKKPQNEAKTQGLLAKVLDSIA